MRRSAARLLAPAFQLALVTPLLLGCGSSTSPREDVADGVWGSAQATLTVADTGATLDILASTNCIGSYGEIPQRIPEGGFDVAGTFTQLIGAYPGHVDYGARFAGTADASQITMTVTVPAIPMTLGPFTLARGVQNTWATCAYP